MSSLYEKLWPTKEILETFMIVITFKIITSTIMAIREKSEMRNVINNHRNCLKAQEMLEDEVTDIKKEAILRQYIRLQEEKIMCNGHSLAQVEENPELAANEYDVMKMIMNIIPFQLLKFVLKDRNPVAMVLPFDVPHPFTMIAHFGTNSQLKSNEVSYSSVNMICGEIIGRIVRKIVFGKMANISMARRMEVMELKMEPAGEVELIKLEGYENLEKEFPDIKEAEMYEETD